jgi:mono/diheme cytochrome c family protein
MNSIRKASALAVLFLGVICSRGEEPRELPVSILKWNADALEARLKTGEFTAEFHFFVRNVSDRSIVIRAINPSCGCTAVTGTDLPITLNAHDETKIPVMMDVTGKSGSITKTLLVATDEGSKTLFVTSHIAPLQDDDLRRMNNQGVARANRQAVLHGSCAACHVQPAEGKLGMELFQTACSICHVAERRAEFVPDLNPLRGDRRDAIYWRTHIREGRKDTLMPAFSAEEGGFLSDAQIESLVQFLLEKPPTNHSQPPR